MTMATDLTVQPLITDTVIIAVLVIVGMFIVFLMIREMRILKTTNRKAELDLEREKLSIIQQHAETKTFPFTRFSAEQTSEIRQVEDDNLSLATTISAKEKLIDTRLSRLENLVKTRKLDTLIGKIQDEEKRVQ